MLEHLEDFEERCRREKAEAYKHRQTVSSTTSGLKLVASSWWVRGCWVLGVMSARAPSGKHGKRAALRNLQDATHK